ncbi:alpha/beta hydrolase [Brevundimonas goettingensis]|nr:alpha/beta hydrolase [Brevundimonas goettingensis]
MPIFDRRRLIAFSLAGAALVAATPGLTRQSAPRAQSYGADPLQSYDLYPGPATGPVLMFVHGGGWKRGENSMVNALPDYARRHGLTLASTSYRLVPDVGAREEAQDVAAAIADLHRRLPGRAIFVLGHSAGAHLAALVGVDPVYLGAHGLKPSDLGGVILLDGAGYDATGPRGRGIVGRALDEMYDNAFGPEGSPGRAELSPTLRVRSGQTYPPFLIFHVASRADSAAQSQALATVLIRAGGRAEVIAAPGETHMTINRSFGVADDPEGERGARFIAEHS